MEVASVVLKLRSKKRNILSTTAFSAMLVLGTYATAAEITLEGTQVNNPKVRGYETLEQPSTSAGPVVVQASTQSFFVPNVHTEVRDLNGTRQPSLDDVGLVFVGTLTEGSGTFYQYFFNKFTFCNAVGNAFTYEIDFRNAVNGVIDSSQFSWINCSSI